MSNISPEALRRAREMLSELNNLVERRNAGEDVQADFEQFMSRYGDLIPGDPANLDELLESLASQLAAARELLESLTPEQRAKLAELSEALLEDDLELRMELERLAASLASAAPGSELFGLPLGLGPGSTLASQLSDLGGLEQLLGGAPSPGALAEVDIERGSRAVGRGGCPLAGSSRQPGSSAARLGIGRTKGRPPSLNPARAAPDRGPGTFRPLHEACPVPRRPAPRGHAGRRARTRRRDKGVRMGRCLQPLDRTDCAQRPGPARPWYADRAFSRRFRSRANGIALPLRHCHNARPLTLDANEGQFPGREKDGHRAARASYRAGSHRITSG